MKEFYLQHFGVRLLCYGCLIFLLLLFFVFLFLRLWPSFGGHASKNQKEEYRNRASNYVNEKFQNEKDLSLMSNSSKENHFVSTKGRKPMESLPTMKPNFLTNPSVEDLTVTWFGHSTILIQMSGMNILVDPIFSEYASPIQFVGPKRFSHSPISIHELPKIDVVLITHDHYDHLDYKTIQEIDSKVIKYIVPLGVENHLIRWKIDEEKIHNMAWWEEFEMNGLTIACTPAQHFSGRSLNDQFNTLWASYVLKNESYTIFESGDTGFGNHFEEIHKKYGDMDLVMLDSGQYNVMWEGVHMHPEEVIQASEILHARVTMPIHYGAFVLSNHPWDDGLERISNMAPASSRNLATPMIGQTIRYSSSIETEEWWKEID